MTLSKLALPLPFAVPISREAIIRAFPEDNILDNMQFMYAEVSSGVA